MRRMSKHNEEGFTLMELLIVIIIIGILAAVAIPYFQGQRGKATEANIKTDLHSASTVLAEALIDDGVYPSTIPASFKPTKDIVVTLAAGAPTVPISADLQAFIDFDNACAATYPETYCHYDYPTTGSPRYSMGFHTATGSDGKFYYASSGKMVGSLWYEFGPTWNWTRQFRTVPETQFLAAKASIAAASSANPNTYCLNGAAATAPTKILWHQDLETGLGKGACT